MQWLALLAAATISTLPCLATGVTVVNVSIPSPGATVAAGLGRFSSGPGILQGSLWLPDSASSSAPVPAVLLIGGSGGDDRYECSEAGAAGATVCTFYDVVRAITGAGSAALVYDKRTCNYIAAFQGGAPGRADLFPCARPSPLWCSTLCDGLTGGNLSLCLAETTTPPQPCLNILNTSFNDFVADGVAGISLLSNRPEINASVISVLGHSQGCDIAPMVAAFAKRANPSFRAASIISLNGAGVPINDVITAQIPLLVALQEIGIRPGVPPNQTAIQQVVEAVMVEKHVTPADWAALATAPDGAMSEILGVRSLNVVWKQWIACGRNRSAYIAESGASAFLAYNSPADQHVPPQTYQPLQTLLANLTVPTTSPQAFGGAMSWPHDSIELAVVTAVIPNMRHIGDSILGFGECGASQTFPAYLLPPGTTLVNVCPQITAAIQGFLHTISPSEALPSAGSSVGTSPSPGGGGGCGPGSSDSNSPTDKLSAGDDVGIVIGLLAAGVLAALIVSYTLNRRCDMRGSTANSYDAVQMDNIGLRDRDPDGY